MAKIKANVFHTACVAVVKECSDDYCKALAQVGLGLWDADWITHQSMLLLSNIRAWQGVTANQCRRTFKRFSQ